MTIRNSETAYSFGSFEVMPNSKARDGNSQWRRAGTGIVYGGDETVWAWLAAHDLQVPFEELPDDYPMPVCRPSRPPLLEWRY